MTNKRSAEPYAHKTMVVVTDTEWRALKIAAALEGDSVQGWLTRLVLQELQDHPQALELAQETRRRA